MLITSNIIRSATRGSKDRLKCLSVCRENEKYLSTLSDINCDIYILLADGLSEWKPTISKMPQNVFALRKAVEHSELVGFDFIMCHGRLHEFDFAHSLSNALHLPLVTVDHVSERVKQKLPFNASAEAEINHILPRVGDINISNSNEIKDSWNSSTHGISITIPPYVTTANVENEKQHKIIIDNNLPSQFSGQLEALADEFGCAVRFGEQAEADISEFEFYINTWNNIDNKTLEAMACGCITLSPRSPETETVIIEGENGLLFEDMDDLKRIIKECLEDKHQHISANARQFIIDNYSNKEEFDKKWNQVLSFVSNSFFTRK
jgi:hypothetical protein